MPETSAWRMLPLLILIMTGLIILFVGESPEQILSRLAANREWMKDWIGHHPVTATIAYALGYAALMMLLFVPAWLCSTIGGFLFGTFIGVPTALAGATLGASAVFLLARRGLGGLTRRAGPFLLRLESGFQRDAASYLLVLRLVPVVPFTVVNVVSALFGVPMRTFVISTVLGIIPSTLVYVSLGDALGAVTGGNIALDRSLLLEPRIFLPLFGLAVLALLPVLARHLSDRRAHK